MHQQNRGKKPTSTTHRAVMDEILRSVSRSFYLTLRVLPQGVREPVGLGYLLARIADTITDTSILPSDQKHTRLIEFRGLVQNAPSEREIERFQTPLEESGPDGITSRLIKALPMILSELEELSSKDRDQVRSVHETQRPVRQGPCNVGRRLVQKKS